jgi:hypothetical protein
MDCSGHAACKAVGWNRQDERIHKTPDLLLQVYLLHRRPDVQLHRFSQSLK